MEIKIRLEGGAILPTRGSGHAAGYDLYVKENVEISHGEIAKIPTGVYLQIPTGYYGKIEDRSGLAVKYGYRTMAGVIDSDYRGEIIVVMTKLTPGSFKLERGERMAQIIILKHETPLLVVTELESSERGARGFGSTGN